ncbi:GlxA family transcriptional regulator [Pseudogemmobacter sonorensis]|uniref:GlxA family transcriptional regulator n=1 Tax=Pseudogemmobacter sonorensis TaxID=2989681 RepID=UPI00367EA84E
MEERPAEAKEAPAPRSYVAPGVHHVAMEAGAAPVTVTFVLMPQFTLLAFTAALEPFRVANQLAGQELFRWHVHAEAGGAVTSSTGVPVQTDGPLPVEPAPGYVLACGGVRPERNVTPALANWLRFAWRRGCTVGGLCTGAYALAQAGILRGRKFTLHWENIDAFREAWPDLEPARQIYCFDDRIVTCAGGAAGADLSLKIISDNFGPLLGQEVMDMCLLVHRRQAEDGQTASHAARLKTRNTKVLATIALMEARIDQGFELQSYCDHAGVTTRQLQRLFRRHLGMTPQQYMNDLRLRHGRMLLTETNMPVLEVALACGYDNRSSFSKGFRRKYGVAPQHFSHFGG